MKSEPPEDQPEEVFPDAGDVRAGVDPRLLAFADAPHLVITSGIGGVHNRNSKHYRGLAIDVRSHGMTDKQVKELTHAARQAGLRLRDERVRPKRQKVWHAPHLHLEST